MHIQKKYNNKHKSNWTQHSEGIKENNKIEKLMDWWGYLTPWRNYKITIYESPLDPMIQNKTKKKSMLLFYIIYSFNISLFIGYTSHKEIYNILYIALHMES